MKQIVLNSFLSVLFLFLAVPVVAQQLELPQPSPSASIKYRLGLTDIEINYSSPGVKERNVWGELVPYNEMWRTGANASTKISFDKDLTIGRQKVEAGTYALYTIPGEQEWTVIINENIELWGVDGYEEKDDIVRFTVNPQKTTEFVERLRFTITDNPKDAAIGVIALEWENMKISFDVKTNVRKQVDEALTAKLDESKMTWRYLMQGATFYRDARDLDKALELVNQSIDLNKYYYNYYLKGQILAEKGDKDGAVAAANKALEIGPTLPEDLRKRFENYKESIIEARDRWSGKSKE